MGIKLLYFNHYSVYTSYLYRIFNLHEVQILFSLKVWKKSPNNTLPFYILYNQYNFEYISQDDFGAKFQFRMNHTLFWVIIWNDLVLFSELSRYFGVTMVSMLYIVEAFLHNFTCSFLRIEKTIRWTMGLLILSPTHVVQLTW